MKYTRISYPYLATITILAIGLIGFTGCAVMENDIVAPRFEELKAPPIKVTIDQLYAEYMVDGLAAEDKYNEKRLLFYGLTVEEVFSVLNPGNEVFQYNAYIIADNAKFIPRHFVYTDNIRVGFVVDIVGRCNGLIRSNIGEPFLQISDCWINIVEGETVEDWYLDPEAY